MLRNLLLSSVCALISIRTAATDRVVSPSGTYNTISSAISASSDGDRILVASANYLENILVNKSLTIQPVAEGGRYSVLGSIRLSSAATERVVTISGLRALGGVSTIDNGSARLNIRIVDSYISGAFNVPPSCYVELYRDTIPTSVSLYNGAVIGNRFTGTYTGSAPLNVVQGTTVTAPLFIIGNSFGQAGGLMTDYLIEVAFNHEFHVDNNFASVTSSTTSFFRFNGQQQFGTPTCTINSNTFYRPASANLSMIWGNNNQPSTVEIVNNVSINNTGPLFVWVARTGLVSGNQLAAASWINTSTGEPSVGSPLINAGDPDPRYLDLDLTTNDAGCYGGSNSRANFITPMGSAVVGFMQAPRVVAQGEVVNISATGFDR